MVLLWMVEGWGGVQLCGRGPARRLMRGGAIGSCQHAAWPTDAAPPRPSRTHPATGSAHGSHRGGSWGTKEPPPRDRNALPLAVTRVQCGDVLRQRRIRLQSGGSAVTCCHCRLPARQPPPAPACRLPLRVEAACLCVLKPPAFACPSTPPPAPPRCRPQARALTQLEHEVLVVAGAPPGHAASAADAADLAQRVVHVRWANKGRVASSTGLEGCAPAALRCGGARPLLLLGPCHAPPPSHAAEPGLPPARPAGTPCGIAA